MINANLSAFSVGKAVGRRSNSLAAYTGDSFSTNVKPKAVTWTGASLLITTNNNNSINSYTVSGSPQPSINIGFEAVGIVYDSNPSFPSFPFIYAISGTSVQKLRPDGTYISTFNVSSQYANAAFGIFYDGVNFWIVGRDGSNRAKVTKWSNSGVYQNVSFNATGESRAIAGDGTFLYVLTSDNKISQYTTAGLFTGKNFSVSNEITLTYGLAWSGNYFFVTGYNENKMFKYALS